MSTSAAQAVPSLISLVKCADAVLHDVLEPNVLLLRLTTYFDKVVHVKCLIEAHYPSTEETLCAQARNATASKTLITPHPTLHTQTLKFLGGYYAIEAD
ncbi:hypothetical protein EDD85DRAFT_959077 [Armillaria nabsnona]|nr:hypothetical protein EDD85DRAFT_959077 [Armillaria nabsnona]